MRVDVVLALPGGARVVRLELENGATAGDAVRASGLAPGGVAGIGRFGEAVGEGVPLSDGDRIELYRPLAADPREARRRRARRRGTTAG